MSAAAASPPPTPPAPPAPPIPAPERPLRIGEVAELTATTARTIRYYEEIGLLDSAPERQQGKHRCYTRSDVERVREIIRLRDLLGLSLEQLSQLLDAESARAHLKSELAQTKDPSERRRILDQLLGHITSQLALVRDRQAELDKLAAELTTKQGLVRQRLSELSELSELGA